MKKELKEKILKLKADGKGYKAIASELSISIGAVRGVCNSKYNDPEMYGTCKTCGARISFIKGKKKRQFCSDKCRMIWWNNHQDLVKRKAYYTFVCPHCNKEFTAYGNKSRKYCSYDCYLKSKVKDNDGK